jgi:hypothetical protein
VRVGAIFSCLQDFPTILLSNSLTKMIKKTLIVTTDTLSKFSLAHFDYKTGFAIKIYTKKKVKHTLTKYENIAVTLCLMSIAIRRRRLRDRARVRRRATRYWLLRRKQRIIRNNKCIFTKLNAVFILKMAA